jgi:hypothetical protein
MKYKIGDILVCSTNWTGSQSFDLVVGDQYEVLDLIDFQKDSFTEYAFNVKNIKNSKMHYFCSDRLFIPLEVWREFQLRKILN